MTDDVKKQFDAFYLFVRNDEKVAEVQADLHDVQLAIQNIKNNQDKMEGRVNQGVAVTGQNNSKSITEHAVSIATLRQTVEKLVEEVDNPETGVFKQIKEIKDAVAILYKGIVTIFFSLFIGGVVVYALKFIRFG